jgi:hypothetical protein
MVTIQVPENTGSFLIRCIQFQEEMMNDIRLCRRKGLNQEEELESCFEITTNYITQLTNELSSYRFGSDTDEILFFKKIKPLFTAEAEYFTYCYHAGMFKDMTGRQEPAELESFYRRQLQRMDKFSREHPAFYSYMQSEATDKDSCWFKRLPDDPTRCFYDKQLATYGAIQKYELFIQGKLKAMGADSSKSESEESRNL